MLIDTGASSTCIDPACIAPLNIQPTGTIQAHTPSTAGMPVTLSQYALTLAIPLQGSHYHFIYDVPVAECHLQAQGIDGLLGRDVLAQAILIYNGTTGLYTLSF